MAPRDDYKLHFVESFNKHIEHGNSEVESSISAFGVIVRTLAVFEVGFEKFEGFLGWDGDEGVAVGIDMDIFLISPRPGQFAWIKPEGGFVSIGRSKKDY
jgi:hypothetical protein